MLESDSWRSSQGTITIRCVVFDAPDYLQLCSDTYTCLESRLLPICINWCCKPFRWFHSNKSMRYINTYLYQMFLWNNQIHAWTRRRCAGYVFGFLSPLKRLERINTNLRKMLICFSAASARWEAFPDWILLMCFELANKHPISNTSQTHQWL